MGLLAFLAQVGHGEVDALDRTEPCFSFCPGLAGRKGRMRSRRAGSAFGVDGENWGQRMQGGFVLDDLLCRAGYIGEPRRRSSANLNGGRRELAAVSVKADVAIGLDGRPRPFRTACYAAMQCVRLPTTPLSAQCLCSDVGRSGPRRPAENRRHNLALCRAQNRASTPGVRGDGTWGCGLGRCGA